MKRNRLLSIEAARVSAARLPNYAGLISAIFLSVPPTTARTALAQWSLFGDSHAVSPSGQLFGPQVFGDRIMIVLEANSHPWRLPDSASKVRNIRGYLVTARLSPDPGTKDAAQVVGPLYTIDSTIS